MAWCPVRQEILNPDADSSFLHPSTVCDIPLKCLSEAIIIWVSCIVAGCHLANLTAHQNNLSVKSLDQRQQHTTARHPSLTSSNRIQFNKQTTQRLHTRLVVSKYATLITILFSLQTTFPHITFLSRILVQYAKLSVTSSTYC